MIHTSIAYIILARKVSNILCELRNIGQVLLLTSREQLSALMVRAFLQCLYRGSLEEERILAAGQ